MKSKSQLLFDIGRLAGALLLGALLLPAALSAQAEDEYSYSYARLLDGPSELVLTSGDSEDMVLHQPVLVGDRVRLPWDSRLELELSDRTLLRLEGEAEVEFNALAYSADTHDRATVLRLAEGEMQLIVPSYALGDELPRIDTPDASIYIERSGVYRIVVADEGWTELVVREGLAEMVTDVSTLKVHPEEMAFVEGGRVPRFEVRQAGSRNALELWGDRLSEEARASDGRHVDETLRYTAAPLERHGVWVRVGGRYAWRPRVTISWRPYNHGYWRESPTGMVWVSYDPWGYMTHHYGTWDHSPGYGWVWYPGRSYSPANVYWYYGPNYVGWCPTGYYSSYYGGHGLGHGIYGRAGGSFHHFSHWSFVTAAHFGHGYHYGHHGYGHGGRGGHGQGGRTTAAVYSGAELAERFKAKLAEGIITRDSIPGRKDPGRILEDLRRETEKREHAIGRRLDATDFVAKKPLSDEMRAVLGTRRESAPGRESGASVAGRPTGKPTKPADLPRISRPESRRPAVTSEAGRPTLTERRTPRVVVPEEKEPRRTIRLPEAKPRDVESRPTIESRRTIEPKPRPEVRRPEVRRPEAGRPEIRQPERRTDRRPSAGRPEIRIPESRTKPQVSPPSSKPRVSPPSSSSKPTVRAPSSSGRSSTPRISKPSSRKPSSSTPRISKPSSRKPSSSPKISKPSSSRSSKGSSSRRSGSSSRSSGKPSISAKSKKSGGG